MDDKSTTTVDYVRISAKWKRVIGSISLMSFCIEIRLHSFTLALQQVIANLDSVQHSEDENAIIIILSSDVEHSAHINDSENASFWEIIRAKLEATHMSRTQMRLHFWLQNLPNAKYETNELHLVYHVAKPQNTQLMASDVFDTLTHNHVTIFLIQLQTVFNSHCPSLQMRCPKETLICQREALNSSVRVSWLHPSYSLVETWYRAFQPLDQYNIDCRGQIAYEIYSACTLKSSLPLSLLLLLARWTHCHPIVMREVEPFIQKKARYLHQRHRKSIQKLLGSCELFAPNSVSTASIFHQLKCPILLAICESDNQRRVRLSQCRLWDRQKHFYKTKGMDAWSKHHIPCGISGSSLIAQHYARTFVK